MTHLRQSVPPVDHRYLTRRSGDETFAMLPYPSLEAWEQRAAWLREHILCVLGLWPLPERTPLHAEVFDRTEYDDYAVEKVRFESWPGFYCTGNLFRPLRASEPVPAILNPHGHAERGRLEHSELYSARARCITFARMGMVALAYDMVGYNDSLQTPKHRFWSWLGASWGMSPMAIQLWNTLRAVDFLAELQGVDPERIGCTGESGGGTQTFMAAAVEPRLRVVAPVNMISAHFQGGCVCENVPGLRSDTYNVEIAALAAPRPMLMVSATGDWTVNTPSVEYPTVRRIYELYQADDRLACAQVDAEHNYNAASREHVYRWFAQWFLGNAALGNHVERPFVVEADERLRIYPVSQRPDPAETAQTQARFVQRARDRLALLFPRNTLELAHMVQVTRVRLQHTMGVTMPAVGEILAEFGEQVERPGWIEQPLALGRAGAGDRVRAVLYTPPAAIRGTILVAHGAGLAGLESAMGEAGPLLAGLIASGYTVLAVEVLYTGPVPRQALPSPQRDWFQATFNPPLLGWQVQDLLTGLGYLAQQGPDGRVTLMGLGAAGQWALLAGALSSIPAQVYADLAGLGTGDDALEVPSWNAYGGLAAACACLAPRRLLLGHVSPQFDLSWARQGYALTESGALQVLLTRPDNVALMGWING